MGLMPSTDSFLNLTNPLDVGSSTTRTRSGTGRRLWSLMSVAALLSGLAMTAIAVNQMRSVENRAAKAEFESRSQRIAHEIERRIASFVILAQGAAGLLDGRYGLTNEAWQIYVARLELERDWLGFRNMALALVVAKEQEVGFVADQGDADQKKFRIWQKEQTGTAAVSLASKSLPITLIAPKTSTNEAMIGFDLATDPVRAMAIVAARDSGQPALTAPLETLNADGSRDNGLVLMAPIYRSGKITRTAGQRQNFLGVIVLGMDSASILEDVLSGFGAGGVALRLIDQGSGKVLINTFADAAEKQSLFTYSLERTLGRRDWLFEFQTSPAYEAAIDRQQSELVGAAGVLISALLAILAYSQVALRYRAEERAQEMTADLRASEERFRLIAEAAGEGIWEQDFLTHRIYWSPRLLTEILGYPPEAIADKSLQVSRIIHPEDRERWQEARRRHLQNGVPYYIEYRLKHAAGHWIWIGSRGKAAFDARGTPVRIAGSMADISERKHQELALAKQQALLRTILDALPDPVVVKHPEGNILIANAAFARQVNVPLDEIAGRTLHEMFAPNVAQPVVALDRGVAASGVSGSIEIRIPDPMRGGELRYVHVMTMRCEGLEGESLIISTHQDVTAIRRSENRFRELSEMSSDWFWEQDAEFRFIELTAGVRSTGRDPLAVIGKCRWDLPIDWSPQAWADHRRLLEAHQPFSRLQYRIRNEQGEWRWYSISGKPVFDDVGRFIGYRGTGIDITARKNVEEDLRHHRDNLATKVQERTAELMQAKVAAEEANQAKSEFLANMSHELRTPLHAILSFAQLGQTKGTQVSPEKVTGYFSKIHSAGSRLLGLVNNLLDLSKLEAGKMALNVSRLNLVTLVQEVADELEALASLRDLRFDLPSPKAVVMVSIDPVRFGQVMHNLLSNAIKFSLSGGTIQVDITEATLSSGRRVDDPVVQVPAWRIAVIDEGIGIPDEELDTVFDKFVQSSKTSTGAGGTGLGLTIAKEIVEAHQGQIRAYNRGDAHEGSAGVVFEVLIPRDAADQEVT